METATTSLEKSFSLPDEQVIALDTERLRCAEAPFQPSIAFRVPAATAVAGVAGCQERCQCQVEEGEITAVVTVKEEERIC